MSPAEMWSLVVGFASATIILPIIQQPRWSGRVRAAVTFGYCIVAGLGTAWLAGDLDGRIISDARSVVGAVLVVLVSAIAVYKGFAKPIGLARVIEQATSSDKER